MAIEERYTAFEKAKNYTKQYELDAIDSIVTRQEDGMLGYLSAGQFATTGSNIFTSGQIIMGNLTIAGDIFANEFLVTTSSVEHFTASTNFGLDSGDTHKFTGSVSISGSLNVIGSTTSLGDSIITGSIYFATGSTKASILTGELAWDDTDGTLELGLKGGNVRLQVGQKNVVRVVNKTGANLTEAGYKAVKISSAQGQRLAVNLARANNDANSADTLGLVTEDIAVNQEGFITTFGLVNGINTTGDLQGETWNDGDMLFLSPYTSGSITNIKPQAPNHMVIVGFVVYSHQNNGKIFVKVDNGYELDELHNVRINGSIKDASVNNGGSTLYYSSSVWTNNDNVRLANSTMILASVSSSYNFANDTAAASGGIPLGGLYHTSGSVKIRLV